MNYSPVALFVYNRPGHTSKTVEALKKNIGSAESELYVFSDAARDSKDNDAVSEVRSYIQTIDGFKKVTILNRESNFGLANSIIEGVSQLCNNYGKVIVLEDDLVTSPYFLTYMNSALKRYQDDSKVMSISAFGRNGIREGLYENELYDAYFVQRNSSWGWGTWKDSWLLADWNVSDYEDFIVDKEKRKRFSAVGEDLCLMLDLQQHGFLDSWSIRWTYAHYLNEGVSLVPYNSYVKNIGFDGSGTHCRSSDRFEYELTEAKKNPFFPPSVYIRKDTLAAFYAAHKQRLISRIYWKIKLLGRRLGLL
ncbi:MAG: hypothetical protein ACJAS1_005137 [Oleiphilaceae bacterium]|jgi:hypothetical protein